MFQGSKSLCLDCQNKLRLLKIKCKEGNKAVWITYLWNDELESFYQRIIKFHDLSLGRALLENQSSWTKPLLKYPIFAADFDYNTEEFHALFQGIVLRDIQRVNRRVEISIPYIACLIYPSNPQTIKKILQDHNCKGVWMMAQKEEWLEKSWIRQMIEKMI